MKITDFLIYIFTCIKWKDGRESSRAFTLETEFVLKFPLSLISYLKELSSLRSEIYKDEEDHDLKEGNDFFDDVT